MAAYTNRQIVAVYIQEEFNKTRTAEKLKMTFANLIKTQRLRPELKEMMAEAEEARIFIAEEQLHKLIKVGEFKAIKFLLETKGRKHGYGKKIEIIKEDGDRKFSTVKIVDGGKVIELK